MATQTEEVEYASDFKWDDFSSDDPSSDEERDEVIKCCKYMELLNFCPYGTCMPCNDESESESEMSEGNYTTEESSDDGSNMDDVALMATEGEDFGKCPNCGEYGFLANLCGHCEDQGFIYEPISKEEENEVQNMEWHSSEGESAAIYEGEESSLEPDEDADDFTVMKRCMLEENVNELYRSFRFIL